MFVGRLMGERDQLLGLMLADPGQDHDIADCLSCSAFVALRPDIDGVANGLCRRQ
jgi:hypothetical protein